MVRQDRTPRRRLDPDSRREAILAAAAAAFADRPFADVTIASIAADAQASSSLVYRYFAGKEELYAQVVGLAIEELLDKQAAALDALDEGVPVCDRIGAATLVYLDHIASHPDAWAAPLRGSRGEPQAAAELRVRVRADYVERLAGRLAPTQQARRCQGRRLVVGHTPSCLGCGQAGMACISSRWGAQPRVRAVGVLRLRGRRLPAVGGQGLPP